MDNTVRLTPSQEKAYNSIMAGYNVFLTGHAGTGKSFLLRKVIEDLQTRGKNVVVAAPTGIAALNVGGTTLHRLFMLKPDIYTDRKGRVPPALKKDGADVLFIDEISMCRIDLFDYIGRVLQKTHRRIQVVVIGDFCQLPPVMPRKSADRSSLDEKGILDMHFGFDVGGGYAFLSPQWKRLNFKTVVLKEVVRQDDPTFILALDYARRGNVRSLNYFANNSAKHEIEGGIYLAGRNKEVDILNSDMLDEIDAPSFFYVAKCIGEVSNEDKRVAPEELELKVGARVMTTCNDDLGEFVNGSLGYVTKLDADHVWIRVDDGNECEVRKNSWEIVRYEMQDDNKTGMTKFKRTVAGQYIQYPLRLAWAVTIHKSQGQTFAKVNLNPNCWDSGQLYVALSRVKAIDGLHFTKPLYSRYLRLDPVIVDFYNTILATEEADAGIARDMVYSERETRQPRPKEKAPLSSSVIRPTDQMSLFEA